MEVAGGRRVGSWVTGDASSYPCKRVVGTVDRSVVCGMARTRYPIVYLSLSGTDQTFR
jgi:hypothetical protein